MIILVKMIKIRLRGLSPINKNILAETLAQLSDWDNLPVTRKYDLSKEERLKHLHVMLSSANAFIAIYNNGKKSINTKLDKIKIAKTLHKLKYKENALRWGALSERTKHEWLIQTDRFVHVYNNGGIKKSGFESSRHFQKY